MIKKIIKFFFLRARGLRDDGLSHVRGKKIGELLPHAVFNNPHRRVREKPRAQKARARILILIPAYNVEGFVPRLVQNLMRLSYPHHLVDIAFLEGDSEDKSYETIERQLPQLCDFRAADLHKKEWGQETSSTQRWRAKKQRARRTRIAKVRNHLLQTALREEHQWVLWIDGDVMHWQPDVISALLSYERDIIVPLCVDEAGKDFDLNSFVYDYDKVLNWQSYIYDGLLQPPVGFGRSYLSAYQDYDVVTLDGVGATMLLVRADVHRRGVVFPEEPLHHHIETEGFAFLARQRGISAWGAPQISIIHPRY